MSESSSPRPHPFVRRLSTSARRAIVSACESVGRAARNPMPLKEQAAAWFNREPEKSDDAGPLGKARRLEAVALLGLSEVDRAAQACGEAITTLEEEMEENVDAVVPLRDTIGRLSDSRTQLESERSRLMEEHRGHKAERVSLERATSEADPGVEHEAAPNATAPRRRSGVIATLDNVGERITDFMDMITAAIARRFARR